MYCYDLAMVFGNSGLLAAIEMIRGKMPALVTVWTGESRLSRCVCVVV